MSEGLYLYGIFPLPEPQVTATGLDRAPVQVQAVRDFAFLYTEAQQERYLASRRNLIAHTKVLEQAMADGHRTLLPLRFGLVVASWEAVARDLLDPQGDALRALLRKLDGQREVSLKIYWDGEAELQALLAENHSLRDRRDRLQGRVLSMDETIAIGQDIERALQHRQNDVVETFRAALDPLASETRDNDLMSEQMILNTAYLIPWDSEAQFGERVEELDRKFEPRLKIRYNNFTPPYNFAETEA